MKPLFILLLCSIIFSCQKPIAEGPQKEYFFPLKAYMDGQIKKLETQQAGVEKLVTIGNKTEEKKIATVNWKKELDPFLKADINKATYLDQYSTEHDTLPNGDIVVIYKALNEDLNTKLLKITSSENEQVKQIEALNKTDNPVYTSMQKLLYEPGKGYEIEAQQDVRFSEEKQFKVKARIIK